MRNISKTTQDIHRESVKSAVLEALFESGLSKDMITLKQAHSLLPKSLIDKGIRDGRIKTIQKRGQYNKILVKVRDIVEYRDELLDEGIVKLK